MALVHITADCEYFVCYCPDFTIYYTCYIMFGTIWCRKWYMIVKYCMIPDGLCLQYESQSSFGSIYKTRIEGNNMFCDYYNPSSRTYCKRLRVLCPEHSKDPKVNDTEVCIIKICEWMNGLLQGWMKHVVHMYAFVVSRTVIVVVAKVNLKLKRQFNP